MTTSVSPLPARALAPALAPPPRTGGARATARLSQLARELDLMMVCVMGMVIVALTSVHMHLGPLVHTRPSFSLLILAGAIAAFKPKSLHWDTLRRSSVMRLMGYFCLVAVGSIAFGISPGGSMFFVMDRWWKVLVVFLVLTLSVRTVRHLALLMFSFVLSIGIISVLGFTVVDMTPTSDGLARLGGNGMFDPNDLGMIILMGVPLALLLLFRSRSLLVQAACAASLVMAPMTLALTGSRGALVGAVVVFTAIFFALTTVPLHRRLLFALVLFGGIALAAPEGYWEQMRTTFDTEHNYNYTDPYGRIELAKRGIGYMLRYPLFGVGIFNFGRAEWSISPLLADGSTSRWLSPHNTFVQVGSETGIPGLLLWCALLGVSSIGLLRLRRRIPVAWERQSAERRFLRDATLYVPISVAAFASTSFFLTHAWTPPVYALFAIAGALQMLVWRELRADRLQAPPRARRSTPASTATTPGSVPVVRPLAELLLEQESGSAPSRVA